MRTNVYPTSIITGADSASVSERFRTSSCIDGVFMRPHRLDALDVVA